MTIPVLGALKVPHRVFAAQIFNTLIDWPCAIWIRRIGEAAALVHATPELLHPDDTKEDENEKHEEHCVTQIWQ